MQLNMITRRRLSPYFEAVAYGLVVFGASIMFFGGLTPLDDAVNVRLLFAWISILAIGGYSLGRRLDQPTSVLVTLISAYLATGVAALLCYDTIKDFLGYSSRNDIKLLSIFGVLPGFFGQWISERRSKQIHTRSASPPVPAQPTFYLVNGKCPWCGELAGFNPLFLHTTYPTKCLRCKREIVAHFPSAIIVSSLSVLLVIYFPWSAFSFEVQIIVLACLVVLFIVIYARIVPVVRYNRE